MRTAAIPTDSAVALEAGRPARQTQAGEGERAGRRRFALLKDCQAILADIDRGASDLPQLIASLLKIVEKNVPDCAASVIFYNRTEFRVSPILSPALPERVTRVLHEAAITSGLHPIKAMILDQAVEVVDDTANPASRPDAARLLAALGIQAFSVQPIVFPKDNLVASLLLLHTAPYTPGLRYRDTIEAIRPIARITIENHYRQSALDAANDRVTSIATSLPGVVYQRVVDLNSGEIRYTYISDGAYDLFGVSPDEILEDPQALFECHGPEYSATFRDNLLAASREMRMWDVEAQIISRDGTWKWSHAIARPRKLPNGNVLWSGVILDATRIKEASIVLAQSNRAKTEFLANISHELRTPLNAIIGFSDVILNEVFGPLGNERYRHYVGDINASGTHLLELINNILDISKVESQKMILLEADCDPAETIRSAVRLLGERASSHRVALRLDLPAELPVVWADPIKLRQVMINLVSNAIKFTPDGGTVTVSAVPPAHGGDDLVIRVQDTGIGIAAEDIEKVFQLFTQVDCGLNRKFAGTGLGLPLSKSLIELHGGTLTLDSVVDAGTIVTIRLPPSRLRA